MHWNVNTSRKLGNDHKRAYDWKRHCCYPKHDYENAFCEQGISEFFCMVD